MLLSGWALTGWALAGCSQVVEGSAAVAPLRVPASSPTAAPSPAPDVPARSGLDVDVVDDECLLNASEFAALVGTAVRPPKQGSVARGDGSTGFSCVATAGAEPVAMVNVYRVRTGTPADYVRAGGSIGRHDLVEVGEAATVYDTDAGPTLQLASPHYLVTVLVARGTPTDDAWTAAATAALSRLPR